VRAVAADGAGDALTVTPVGVVRGGREQADDDQWGGVEAVIELDAVDGTPVLDVKPWMAEFAPREPSRQPQWSGELMRDYYA
jgi:hypothetical protein